VEGAADFYVVCPYKFPASQSVVLIIYR
jgi:hypothetical protein